MLKKTHELNYEHYNNMVDVFKQPSLIDIIKNENAVSGYRVVTDVSFEGFYYYLILIFSDGKGLFKYMFEETNFYNNGKSPINKSKNISIKKTKNILKVINDNDFYGMPIIPIKELSVIVFDGTTIFIEGHNGKDTHLIETSIPEDSIYISNIYEAFKKFAEKL